MERAVAHLNKKVCRVGGIWRPINIDVVRPFLVPKERDGIVAFEGTHGEAKAPYCYYENPRTNQYILAFHREAIPRKPKEPLSRRLLIRKGEQAPVRVPDRLIIPSREQERFRKLVEEMHFDLRSRTGLVRDSTIEFLQDPATRIVYAIIRMKKPKPPLVTKN